MLFVLFTLDVKNYLLKIYEELIRMGAVLFAFLTSANWMIHRLTCAKHAIIQFLLSKRLKMTYARERESWS